MHIKYLINKKLTFSWNHLSSIRLAGKYGLLLVIYFCLLASKCKKEELSPEKELAKLPAATQTGANTFGCLINGKAFLPNGSIFAGPRISALYQYVDGGLRFLIAGSQRADTKNLPIVQIGASVLEIKEGGTYPVVLEAKNKAYGNYYFAMDRYDTRDSIGEFHITKLDQLNLIVSGTFWFDAKNQNGDKVEIREGRFDVHYLP